MTWSFSRLSAFEECPYGWFLKYIKESKEVPHFFAQYGSLAHKILQKYYTGELTSKDLIEWYITLYPRKVTAPPPNATIAKSYFKAGYDYFKYFTTDDYDEIIGIEKKVNFSVDKIPFVGYIDLICHNANNIIIIDHKSKDLKPISECKKKDLSTFNESLKQLYLYSIPVKEEYGRFPDELIFNCYRTRVVIKESFDVNKLEETKQWALDTINKIKDCEEWEPKPDYWKCRYICSVCNSCEYKA